MSKSIIITGIVISFIIAIITNVFNAESVVILEGYEHGVAMCEYDSDVNEDMVTQEDEYHMWVAGGVLYIINYGHLSDTQVTQLVSLATTICAPDLK